MCVCVCVCVCARRCMYVLSDIWTMIVCLTGQHMDGVCVWLCVCACVCE